MICGAGEATGVMRGGTLAAGFGSSTTPGGVGTAAGAADAGSVFTFASVETFGGCGATLTFGAGMIGSSD